MTRLLLVRHGATSWTHESRLQGSVDIDLCDDGRRDVERLAPIVAAARPASVVVSPLARARSTERALRRAAGAAWGEPVVDERWAEHGLGEWEGLTPEQIGDEYARWRAGEIVPPGGEGSGGVRRRVRAASLEAAARPGPVLVVTHGGVIRAALAELLGLTADRLRPVDAPSVTALDVDPTGSARLAAFNLTA